VDRVTERTREIETAIADIRETEARGVTPETLQAIRARLAQLAARTDLFTAADFPPPQPGEKRNSCLYRLWEDADHRFALYANSSRSGHASPPHNHTTWAVIVGISGGDELNRFYERTPDGGVRETGNQVVRQGSGVAFMPDDLHSIHIQDPLLNFHLYGRGLEQLTRREYYKAQEHAWAIFPPHSDIREARAAVLAANRG
jgi:predicted metal-dependent enzyme (double-stranded beta helix superfamily)